MLLALVVPSSFAASLNLIGVNRQLHLQLYTSEAMLLPLTPSKIKDYSSGVSDPLDRSRHILLSTVRFQMHCLGSADVRSYHSRGAAISWAAPHFDTD
jgi:hypothetical protein